MCVATKSVTALFQHSAARRRLTEAQQNISELLVSTLSRPKAAAFDKVVFIFVDVVSTLSRPKAADRTNIITANFFTVSTLSRPKAAEKSDVIRHRG